MTRVAIYARFSSDRQDARSIDDQVALCRDYANRQGWRVVEVYTDAAISGASMHGREAFGRLIADSELPHFDVVLAADLDRFSRNIADMETFRANLEFRGIDIHSVNDGAVTKLHTGIKGLMGSLFLDALKAHTRRGMRGRVLAALSAGGKTYGYRPGPTKGQRIIVEHEKAVIIRIFQEYDSGRSPREIAQRLNADRIAPPRGTDWIASAINGNPVRGSGILSNALYDGRLVWNRVSMRKDPATGKRVSRPNPPKEWIVTRVPDLRIVPAELFARVQAAKAKRGNARPEHARRPRHLLAGLLRCGWCGGAMAVSNVTHQGRRIYCGRRKEGGRCENGHSYKLAPIEQRVLAGLKAQLADPRAIERYLQTYRAERKRLAAGAAGKRAALERELGQVKRAIDRIVEAIGDGAIDNAEVRTRMAELRRRRENAEADLATLAPAPKIALHPAAVASYLATVNDLAATLSRRIVDGDEETATALRELVAAVVIHPTPQGEPRIEVTGRLAKLTGTDLFPQQVTNGTPTVVAGAGLEPATSGL
jgi:site-specific DNA recombinase